MTDAIAEAAAFLAGQLDYVRHQPWADEFFADIQACARVMRSAVDGGPPQKYLGPCGAELEVTVEAPELGTLQYPTTCDGDVYGVPGAERGRCKTCGATVDQGERRAWLDDVVRDYAYRASEIANAYGINVNTIRTWAHDRAALYDHAGNITRPARPAVLRTHAHDRDGRPLFLLGDVLELAAEAAARREETRAARARRHEAAEMGA